VIVIVAIGIGSAAFLAMQLAGATILLWLS
jgi:hypothetical protein